MFAKITCMKIEQLPKGVTLYQIAKVLGMRVTSTYKWKTRGIPPLAVYRLKELKPEWFVVDQQQ